MLFGWDHLYARKYSLFEVGKEIRKILERRKDMWRMYVMYD